MTDEVKTTQENAVNNPEETVNQVEETVEETVQETTTEETTEPTLGDSLPEKPTVGLDKFLDQKRVNKELKQKLQDLEARIEEGSTKKEVSSDIRALADQHNVDPEFLESFAEAVRQRAESVVEEKLRPLTERQAEEKREQTFNTYLKQTLEQMPEYKDAINPDILKQLAYNPANKNKTFKQLLEETYGNVVKPRKTIETGTPRGGADQPLDYEKANKDGDYFKEVMASPELKAKYNEEMIRRMS